MGEEKEEHYRRLCLSDPKTLHLAPGAAEYLDYLKENQVPVTIATSSDLKNLEFYFAHFPLSRWFQKERCVYEDGSFPGKPHPDIYLRAAAKIGVMPKDCTVFEDALSGIAAAHAAGIGKIIAVASSAPPQLFQNAPGVTDIISHYDTFILKKGCIGTLFLIASYHKRGDRDESVQHIFQRYPRISAQHCKSVKRCRTCAFCRRFNTACRHACGNCRLPHERRESSISLPSQHIPSEMPRLNILPCLPHCQRKS